MMSKDKTDPRTDNYRSLLAKLKEFAAIPRPRIFGLVTKTDVNYLTDELVMAHCADVAILSATLIYEDLANQGIDPDLGRLIVLALLAADGAPIAHLKEELVIAAADVVNNYASSTKPACKPLFSVRNWVEPTSEAAIPVVAAALPAANAGFTPDKWFSAMTTQGAA
jgi:hypothetical protein